MYRSIALTLIISFGFSGCYLKPELNLPQEPTPSSFDSKLGSGDEVINKKWWTLFGDKKLESLIDEALKNNTDLLIAAAAVAQSRAELGLSRANQYPTINANADASRMQRSLEAFPQTPGKRTYNDYALNGILGYELDLWGKLSSAKEAALAALLSSQASKGAIEISLASDVANAYFALITLNEQLLNSDKIVASWQESLDIYRRMYKLGEISELTVFQTEAALESAKIDRESIALSRDTQNKALKMLLGRGADEISSSELVTEATTLPLDVNSLKLPSFLPSQLLERRPDIVAALESVKSANALIGATRALYFPTISLTGIFGGESEELKNLFKGGARLWSLGGGLTTPIFQFGRIGAQVDSAKAQKESALLEYQKTVRYAFKEVADSINTHNSAISIAEYQGMQTKALDSATALATKQYEYGATDYLTLLSTKRSYFDSKLQESSKNLDTITSLITLYKALGGGWDSSSMSEDR